MILGMGLFNLGINLTGTLGLGSCLVFRPTQRVFLMWTSGLNSVLISRSQTMPTSGLHFSDRVLCQFLL